MCGRYSETKLEALLRKRFRISGPNAVFPPRYNIAPTQEAPVVVDGPARRLAAMRWGLAQRHINARAESLAEKPAFADAFRNRRCLVPADSFYEWRKDESGRIPVRFALKQGELFAFAGIWENGTFAIVTTDANELVRPVHDRMPVILREEDEELWLDPEVKDPERLAELLRPHAAARMEAYDVSPRLNSPQNDGPELVERYTPPPPAQLSLF